MKTLTYTVHIEPAEEGGYNVFVPALPGCQTQGDTYVEAVVMAKECIEGFLEALAKAGEPMHEPSTRRAAQQIQGLLGGHLLEGLAVIRIEMALDHD